MSVGPTRTAPPAFNVFRRVAWPCQQDRTTKTFTKRKVAGPVPAAVLGDTTGSKQPLEASQAAESLLRSLAYLWDELNFLRAERIPGWFQTSGYQYLGLYGSGARGPPGP